MDFIKENKDSFGTFVVDLPNEYHVTKANIRAIITFKTWKNLPELGV